MSKANVAFSEHFTGQNIPSLSNGEIHLWSVSSGADKGLTERCRAALSAKEQERISYFKFKRVQHNYIISQGVLRLLLSAYLNIEPQKIQLGKHTKGKPFSEDDPSLYFNMSNSGSLCVYAFSKVGEVGIDIENIRHLPDLDELIQKNFTPNEVAYIKKNDGDKVRRFFWFWTIKEAYLKAAGEGMRLTPDNLEFSIENGEIKLHTVEGVFEVDDWIFKEISLNKDYVGTLAYKGRQTTIK